MSKYYEELKRVADIATMGNSQRLLNEDIEILGRGNTKINNEDTLNLLKDLVNKYFVDDLGCSVAQETFYSDSAYMILRKSVGDSYIDKYNISIIFDIDRFSGKMGNLLCYYGMDHDMRDERTKRISDRYIKIPDEIESSIEKIYEGFKEYCNIQ